jgi:hypothetical protein
MFSEDTTYEIKGQKDQKAYVTSEVTLRLEPGASAEMVFTEMVIEKLAEGLIIQNEHVLYSERSSVPYKVNAIGVSDENDRIYVAITEYDTSSAADLTEEEVNALTKRALNFVKFVKGGGNQPFMKGTEEYVAGQTIKEAFRSSIQVRVLILTNRFYKDKTVFKGTSPFPGKKLWVEVYDPRRISKLLRPEELSISFGETPLKVLKMPGNDPDSEVYSAIMSGNALAKTYEGYGPRVLEANVRSFLQGTKANQGIRDTLKKQPERFMAYNNGVVITAEEAETVETEGGGIAITRLKGLQIVNGGQTTASLYMAKYRDKTDISSVYVAAKIIVLAKHAADEYVKKISKFANTQNAIKESDFGSNHPYHVEMQRRSASVPTPDSKGKWYYERTTGQYSVDLITRERKSKESLKQFEMEFPKGRKFNKLDLARCLQSWGRAPHEVSKGRQENFAIWMKSVGDNATVSENEFKDNISKLIIYKAIEALVKEHGFAAYRANITTYTMACLADRLGDRFALSVVWKTQGISPSLRALLLEWAIVVGRGIVETAGTQNVTQWCKKKECWNAIQALDLPPASFKEGMRELP